MNTYDYLRQPRGEVRHESMRVAEKTGGPTAALNVLSGSFLFAIVCGTCFGLLKLSQLA